MFWTWHKSITVLVVLTIKKIYKLESVICDISGKDNRKVTFEMSKKLCHGKGDTPIGM